MCKFLITAKEINTLQESNPYFREFGIGYLALFVYGNYLEICGLKELCIVIRDLLPTVCIMDMELKGINPKYDKKFTDNINENIDNIVKQHFKIKV